MIEAAADEPSMVVIGHARAAVWQARVNGIATPAPRADDRYRGAPTPAGRSRRAPRDRAPGRRTGPGMAALSTSRFPLLRRRPL
jgi:hypothetical protein